MLKYLILEKPGLIYSFLLRYWLITFYIAAIAYSELVYRLWNFKNISFDYIFPVIFAFSAGAVLFLISSAIKERANRIVAIMLTFIMTLSYSMQLIYFCIFHMPLSIYSLSGAGDAMQFGDIILSAVLKNIVGVILLFVPLIFLLIKGREFQYNQIKLPSLYFILIFCITSYVVSIICVNLTDKKNISQLSLYYNNISPELSVAKLGLMTTMRLDFERLVFEFK